MFMCWMGKSSQIFTQVSTETREMCPVNISLGSLPAEAVGMIHQDSRGPE